VRLSARHARSPYPQTVRALADALVLSPAERAALLQARLPTKPEALPAKSAQVPPASILASPPPEQRLPVYLTPFIGREQARAELAKLLATPDRRLITLLGSAGLARRVWRWRLPSAVSSLKTESHSCRSPLLASRRQLCWRSPRRSE